MEQRAPNGNSVLVCTVGTSEAPIKFAIQQAAAEGMTQVVLLYGRQMQQDRAPLEVANAARLFAQGLGCRVYAQEIGNPQNIDLTVQEMESALARLVPAETSVIADITGGTKVMSAALLFTAMGLYGSSVDLEYVGGEVRDAPAGRVSGDTATLFRLPSWRLRSKETVNAFRRQHYATAYALGETLPLGGRAGAVRGILMACRDWDNFAYGSAADQLGGLRKKLEILADDGDIHPLPSVALRLASKADKIRSALRLLDDEEKARTLKLSQHRDTLVEGLRLMAADALANASRRMAEGRPTDSTLRAYRAVEVAVQAGLLARSINPWNPLWESIPETTRNAVRRENGDRLPKEIALGQGYTLLRAFPEGVNDLNQDDLRDLQQSRNFSFLEHGYSMVKAATAKSNLDKAHSAVLQILGKAYDLDAVVHDLQFG